MRELKLKYFIELASNIGAKSRTEAQALEAAQRSMQQSIDRTSQAVGRMDSAFMRFAASTATERQIGYMQRLATGVDQVANKIRGLAALSAKGLQAAPGAVAGVAAGFYAAKTLLDKPIDYDTRLRAATATAYAGKGIDALRTGRAEINGVVEAAVRQAPGATRDGTLGAFEKLTGSGSFSLEESKQLLPSIMRTSVASRSDANDLVAAAEKMKVSLGIKADQMPQALSKIMRAGQEGGFEIKDSAKWMGPLLPYMKGYSGMQGVETLVTMLQQVRSTAGSNDEAANNLRNFLQKMRSDGTVKDFKKQGINLTDEMAKGAALGQTPVDTYMAQLDKVMAKQDPEGKARAAMRLADKSLSPEERKQRYDSVADLYKNAGISKIINDLQEMGGYSGLAGTKDYGRKVLDNVRSEQGGAVDTGFKFMTEGTGAKATAFGVETDIAVSKAFNTKSPILNYLLDKATDLAREFPTLTTAVVGAGSALLAMSAAAGVFSLLVARSAGGLGLPGRPGGGLPGVPGSPGAFPVLDGAAPAAAAGGLGVLGVAAGVLTGGAAASYAATSQLANNKALRDGVVDNMFGGDLSFAAAILSANDRPEPISLPDNHRGKGFNDPRLLTLTAPGKAEQNLPLGQPTKLEVGDGKLMLDIRVTQDGQVAVTPLVTQQPSMIKINAGATNPAGLR